MSGALLAGVLLSAGLASPAFADSAAKPSGASPSVLPSGGQVTAGQARIDRSGSTLTINQGSAKAAIEWSSFSIGKDSTVQFMQPDGSAVALNRVTGSEGSVIDGALKANGQVFVLNPNGVLFGKNAKVDTAGLLATTLKLTDADFLAGKTTFGSDATSTRGATVVNHGSLNAKDGGYVVLMGNQVRNDGVISARLGTVAMAAGDKVSLNFNGDSLVGVVVDAGALEALVANGGAVRADGGLVLLTAKGADGLLNTLVNNTVEIRAQTIENRAGRMYLLGEGGAVEVAGTLDASAPGGGAGGFIETSGPKVRVADGTAVNTRAAAGQGGTWLIDPVDFTIAASGGDITGTTLSNNLANGSVTIQSTSGASGTSGDVNVKDAVGWSSNSTLTLNAQNNIYIYSTIQASGASGKLALEYGQGALANGNTSTYELRGGQVNLHAGQNFDTKLGSDGTVTNWTVITALGAAGSTTGLDLQGINGNASGNYALGADIAAGGTAAWWAGDGFDPIGLAGKFEGFGHKVDGLVINRPSTDYVGLFGSNTGVIRNLGLTNANVTGANYSGSLVGYNNGTVEFTYATGSMAGTATHTGGLVGYNDYSGTISKSSAAVNVSGGQNVGGLLGNNWGNVLDSYATGSVYGLESVGGLIGENYYANDVSRSYASGSVTADVNASNVGGLVAHGGGNSQSNNFWDMATTGQATSAIGTGQSTAQMTTSSTFTDAGWNLAPGTGVWGRRDDLNNKYPVLRSFGYSDRIGVLSIDAAYFANPNATLSYTTSGLLGGDTMTLTQSGSTLNYAFGDPNRLGFYDAVQVRSQATTGNLTVNRPIVWNDFKLTLEAAGDINVNAVMTAAGTSQLDLKAGYNFNAGSPVYDPAKTVRTGIAVANDGTPSFAGRIDFVTTAGGTTGRSGSGALTVDGQGYTLVNALGSAADAASSSSTTLQGLANPANVAGRFALAVDIDAAATSGWNGGSGFVPLGTPVAGTPTPFTGALDGLGHTVSNLTVNARTGQPFLDGTGQDWGGLVADAGGARLRNVGLGNVAVQVNNEAGALLGRGTATIDNVWATGSVTSNYRTGGLAGLLLDDSTIKNSQAKVDVRSWRTTDYSDPQFIGPLEPRIAGGLVGEMSSGSIVDSDARGDVNMNWNGASGEVGGGLVGTVAFGGNGSFTVLNSNAWGNVQGASTIGGLLGTINDYRSSPTTVGILVQNANAHGDVGNSGWYTGGLIGQIGGSAAAFDRVVDSHAYGNVAGGSYYSGGLIGMAAAVSIDNSTAAGTVNGGLQVGGLVGRLTSSSITGSAASGATVGAYQFAGGLVGWLADSTIVGSQASSAVAGDEILGGLVGYASNTGASSTTALTNVSATGSVTGSGSSTVGMVGGLVGQLVNADPNATVSISGAQASGVVYGSKAVGGLIGQAQDGPVGISGSTRSGGSVTGTGNYIGGLVGEAYGNANTALSITGGTNASVVSGARYVGGLVGYQDSGSIASSSSSGAVSGTQQNVGGVAGYLYSTSLATSAATGAVTGASGNVGGLVGYADTATVSASYATGAVSGDGSNVGGLIGTTYSTNITTSYASGNVVNGSTTAGVFTGRNQTGGLIGKREYGNIDRSYATGSVSGNNDVGGLIGVDASYSYTTADVYARGSVSGASRVGGLMGSSNNDFISNAYSSGLVTGTSNVGGLIGSYSGNTARVTNSFWDVQTSGIGTAGSTTGSAGGTGKSTADMNATALFTGSTWDFTFGTGVWGRKDSVNDKYPVLRAFGYTDPLALTLAGASKVYGDANPTLGSFTLAGCPTVTCVTAVSLGSAIGLTTGVGSYAYSGANVLSLTFANGYNAGMFDLTLPSASFSITPRVLTVAAASGATRVYDATTQVAASLLAAGNLVNGDSVTLAGTATLAAANVGNRAIVGTGGLTQGNANYTLSGAATSGGVAITPATLSVTATTGASRVYDRSTTAEAGLFEASGLIGNDSTSLTGSAVLASANAGTRSLASLGTLAAGNANYVLASAAPGGSVEVTPRALTVSAVAGATRNYDTTALADNDMLSFGNVMPGDSVALVNGGAVVQSANVGQRALTGAFFSAQLDNPNYTLTGVVPTGSLLITPQPVFAIQAIVNSSKTYDGTTDAPAALLVPLVYNGDTIQLSGSGVLSGANAGVQTLIGLGTLTQDNPNYILTSQTVTSRNVNITPRVASIETVNGATRAYDGTSDAALGLLRIGNAVTGDAVSLAGSGVLASRNAGNQTVGLGSLALANANGNYVLDGSAPLGTVAVTPLAVGVSSYSTSAKVYDGNSDFAADRLRLSGLLGGDVASLGGSATLGGSNVGRYAFSLGNLTLDNANYTLVGTTPSGTVGVLPRLVSLATVAGATQVYDGGTAVALELLTLGNLVSGDSVHLGGSGTLASRDVGSQRVRTGALTLDNANYTLVEASVSGRVAVTARPVSVAGVGSRVYDGGTDAAASLLQITNIVAGDSVTLGGIATLASRNAGAQSFGTGSLTLSNGNYTLVGMTPSGTVTITARPMTVAAVVGASKVYDASTEAAASLLQLSAALGADTVHLLGNATLASRNVGSQGLGLGTLTLDNANYTLAGLAPSGSVAVTPRPVSVGATSGASRVYDGSIDAQAALLQVGGVLGGDSARLSGTAALAGRNVGAQAVGLGSLALSNGNYTLQGVTPSGTVTITARPVSLATVDGATRVYDGSTDASAALLQVTGLVAGDTVQLGGNVTLADRHVGAQAVGLGSLALSNGNYTLQGVTPSGTVTITARPVSLAALDGASRAYDGTNAAAATLLQVTGVASGDTANLGGSATLAGRDVGAQSIGLGSLTLDNPDYTLRGATPGGSVAVTPRQLTVATVDGASRVYDGSTTASAELFQVGNVVAGDTLSLAGSATLASKAVGAQPLVSSALTQSNANYTLAGATPTGSVAITPRTLNLAFTVANKVFDGSSIAAVTASDNRLAGDVLRADVSGAFTDTTVGIAKAVTITGIALAGADAGNYRVASTVDATARGNLLARSVTYTLAAQDPARTYTASGQMLVSAADLDGLVAASFAGTVAGTAPGALSYTLWRDGVQVSGLKEAGAYEVRASFAATDAHYALADAGNTVLRLNVSSPSNGLQETIAHAVRTGVPASATASVYASTMAQRPLAEFNPAPPNVAVAPPAITSAFGAGTPLSIVSSPSDKEPSEGVSLTQARRMVSAAAGQSVDSGSREVRVPVSRNSLAEIVNGGVKLPGGVDQLLFVVKAGQ